MSGLPAPDPMPMPLPMPMSLPMAMSSMPSQPHPSTSRWQRARQDLGQLSWFARVHTDPTVARRTLAAYRGHRLPSLPRRRRRPGSIWAVTMVRDEVDIVTATIEHLFDQGVDHVLVADNGSVDGTRQLLDRMAATDPRVHVGLDREPAYFQAEKMSRLVRAASRAGADWVVPFDADELWFAGHGERLGDHLRRVAGEHPEVGIVKAAFHHMIPTQPPTETPTNPAAVTLPEASFVMDSTPSVPGKVAVRAHRFAMVSIGQHSAMRVGTVSDGLHIAHLLFRGADQLARKVRQGFRAVALTDPPAHVARFWRAGSQLDDDAVALAWRRLQQGLPEPALGFPATGPMVTVRPFGWAVWDPDRVLSVRGKDADEQH